MVVARGTSILAGLAFLMLMGIAVYFRLWTIDYSISSDDTELLRQQFDLANKEAMDESAEWRLMYDKEVDKATKCLEDLKAYAFFFMDFKFTPSKIKGSSQKEEEASVVNHKLAMLQKENAILVEKVETLKRELETKKLKWNSQYMN